MDQDKSSSDEKLVKKENLGMRIDYLKMRLDHTITHLQAASKMIYLIDGAVLAFAYFLVNTFGLSRSISGFLAAISFVLAGINYLQSRFILTQQHWYRQIDQRMRELLDERDLQPVPENRITKNWFTSSHRNLKYIHVWIASWLIVVSVLLLLYASGLFCEIGSVAKLPSGENEPKVSTGDTEQNPKNTSRRDSVGESEGISQQSQIQMRNINKLATSQK